MGMYDVVICDYSLPDGYTGKEFQTKSLDCLLDQYWITEEGRLLLNEKDMKFHGVIEIHDGHRAYEVMFTHGVVEKIEPYDRYE